MPTSTNGVVDDDVNGNGRIDFADVVWLFNNLRPSSFWFHRMIYSGRHGSRVPD